MKIICFLFFWGEGVVGLCEFERGFFLLFFAFPFIYFLIVLIKMAFFAGPSVAGTNHSPAMAGMGGPPPAGTGDSPMAGPSAAGAGGAPKAAGHGGSPGDPAAANLPRPPKTYTAMNLNTSWKIGGLPQSDLFKIVGQR